MTAAAAGGRRHDILDSAMGDCLSENVLADLLSGTATDADRIRAIAHFEHCSECVTLLGELAVADPSALPLDQALRLEEPPPARRVGRYVLLREIGRGGMGVVYAGYDETLDRKVAVKLLHETASANAEQRTRILREAQAMAQIAHPNVVNVFEVGESSGQLFIAMEFVEGPTLGTWQRTLRPWEEVLPMYKAAGAGLQAAHRADLVHRDFKPDNVLLGQDGRPRVADFGLAFTGSSKTDRTASISQGLPHNSLLQSPITVEGSLIGTPAYMSPEQLCGQPADSRSDQWSFCAALYTALYGTRPFAGETLAELSANVVSGTLRPPPADTQVPALIWDALQRGLATDPGRRFPSLTELLSALDIDPDRHPAGASKGRRPLVGLSLGAFGVLLASLTFFPDWSPRHAQVVFVGAAGIGFLIITSLVALFGAALWRNAFHRGFMKSLILQMGLIFALRVLEVFLLGLDARQVLPIELLVMSGCFAMTAAEFLPALWFVAVACAAASVLVAVQPVPWINLFYMAVFTAVGILWTRAARRITPRLPPAINGSGSNSAG